MPPRHHYWTIILEDKPTAFRAHTEEELLPTLRQLQVRHPGAVMKWFARGRLWNSQDEERADAIAKRRPAAPTGERRPRDWRPGGDHKDPRDRFKVSRDEKRRRFAENLYRERREPGEKTERPPRPEGPPRTDGAAPRSRSGTFDRGPRGDRPRGDRFSNRDRPGPGTPGRPPGQADRENEPGGRPGRGGSHSGRAPSGRPASGRPDRPDRPDRPGGPGRPGGHGRPASRPFGRPPSGRPPSGRPPSGGAPSGRPPSGRPPSGRPPSGRPAGRGGDRRPAGGDRSNRRPPGGRKPGGGGGRGGGGGAR
jgi:hypothetical protein